MSDMLKDLMDGLDEVGGFLSGEAEGSRVTVPDEVEDGPAKNGLKAGSSFCSE